MTAHFADETVAATPRPRRGAASSTVAIGTASAFVLLTSLIGLALDQSAPASGGMGTGWHLRGALGATNPASEAVHS